MIWEDAVIFAGQAVFSIALLPAVFGSEKPPRITCAVTGLTLYAMAGALLSLGLWWASSTCALCAFCWTVLLFQRRGVPI